MAHNLYDSLQGFRTAAGKTGQFYSLPALENAGIGKISCLPVSIPSYSSRCCATVMARRLPKRTCASKRCECRMGGVRRSFCEKSATTYYVAGEKVRSIPIAD
jgi:hypothetical protein